jgi:hypothetical protein
VNEADKQYMSYDKTEEEARDPWSFISQQIRGLLALAAIVVGVWMLVAAVVLK